MNNIFKKPSAVPINFNSIKFKFKRVNLHIMVGQWEKVQMKIN